MQQKGKKVNSLRKKKLDMSGQGSWVASGLTPCTASLSLDPGKDRMMGKVDSDRPGKQDRSCPGSAHWLISLIPTTALRGPRSQS